MYKDLLLKEGKLLTDESHYSPKLSLKAMRLGFLYKKFFAFYATKINSSCLYSGLDEKLLKFDV